MGHIPRIFACMKSKNDSIPMSCVQVALVLADSTVSAHHYYVIPCVTMSYYMLLCHIVYPYMSHYASLCHAYSVSLCYTMSIYHIAHCQLISTPNCYNVYHWRQRDVLFVYAAYIFGGLQVFMVLCASVVVQVSTDSRMRGKGDHLEV